MKAIRSFFMAALAACSLTANGFAETFSIFLRIGDENTITVQGEARTPPHANEIDVASFKAGVLQKGAVFAGGGGFGSAKSEFTPLTIFKFLDKASPSLFVACVTGVHFPKATLFIVNPPLAGAALAQPPRRPLGEYFRIELEDVVIASLNQDANTTDANGNLVETVTLSFTKIRWTYTPIDPQTGEPQTPIKGGFDVKKNLKL